MVEPNEAATEKNPAYRPANENPATSGVFYLAVYHRCITTGCLALKSLPWARPGLCEHSHLLDLDLLRQRCRGR